MDTTPAPQYHDMKLMTAQQVADLWGVSDQQIYTQAKRGDIPCVRIGNNVRFRYLEMVKWLDEQTEVSND